MQRFIGYLTAIAAAIIVGSVPALAQSVKHTPFDVTSYKMTVALEPNSRHLAATVDVGFTPLENARSVVFELNGSLKIESITRVDAPPTVADPAPRPAKRPVKGQVPTPTPVPIGAITFVQDQAGVSDLGPSVRIDLGQEIASGTPVVLRFKYAGVLDTPAGGPLLNKRLAFVGDKLGYLMYAARWFPFHDYAADPATADISVSLPAGYQVVGYDDTATGPSNTNGTFHFVQSQPGLVGNIAYGKYVVRDLKYGGTAIKFLTQPGHDDRVEAYAETIGNALAAYAKRFGQASFGNKYTVVEIDDESLDYYSSIGTLFVAGRNFEGDREAALDRLQREAAYQWWGLTVGLKSFDDAWLSQGLAEYSAYSLRESKLEGPKLEELHRQQLEKALTFEPTASLLRAPAALDDQSSAYKYIMYGKGPLVFRLLRETVGKDKFEKILRDFLAQYRGKRASIYDFETLASKDAGENLRYFFARWVEGTGVPEFEADYQILRTRGGKFVTRGTVKQNYDNLRLPVDIELQSEGSSGSKIQTIEVEDASADFNIQSDGKPLKVIIDPHYKLLRISGDLRVSAIARRGIEQFKEGNYSEAQTQFEAALKLDRSNAWVYYNLGLLYLEQRNYDVAIDNFKAALGSGNIDPPWLSVWANIKMGNAYDAKGDRTRAVAAYKRAESDPSDYDSAQDAVKRYLGTPYDPRTQKNTATK